jgi:putative hydrolase of the HAD superfamily
MGIDAVLFDFGGVIVDSPLQAFARYEAAHGLPDGFIRSLNTTNPHTNAWARLERSEIDFAEFCALFEAEAVAAGGKLDARELFAMFDGAIRPPMVDAVRRCHEVFKTGLLTNNFVLPGREGRGGSAHAEVLALFDVIVESSVVGFRKPDPAFYTLACERLGIEPEQAVFLDDLGVNLKPARALGMTTIKVETTEQALQELAKVTGLEW